MDTDTLLDCGHAPSAHGAIDTGYVTNADGRTYCYDCCAADDLARIAGAHPGTAMTFYVSTDGSSVTNWPGRRLMGRVCWGRRHPWSTERYYLSAVDAQGRTWSGTGAPGMWATLRLTKRSR